jgi:hypothetical protein
MKMRFLVWAAIAVGSVALATTIPRAAILACLSVGGMALFAFNRWNAAVKLAITGSVMLAVAVMALTPIETWLNFVPAAIAERFVAWNMFAVTR